MASSVQIELLLDPSGAVSGVRAFETALKGAGTTAKGVGDQVQRAFAPPAVRWSQVPREMDEVGKHALTSLDNVRLLRDDLGIRIPRSMEKAIASSKVLSGAIKGIGAGLLAFGAIEIGFSVGKSAYDGLQKLWEEHLSLTKAAQDYETEVQKTREQAFGNSDSIEDTRLRIDAATEAVKRYQQQSAEAASEPGHSWRTLIPVVGGALDAYHQRSVAHDLAGQAVDSQRQLDTLNREADPKQYHEERVSSIELEHARDGELVGQKKINAELQKTIQLRAEDRRFDVEKQRLNAVESYDKNGKLIPANPIDPNSGASAERDADEIALRKAEADTFLLQKRQNEELTRMREQAVEAGLRGSALYQAQEAAAIADLKFKDMDSAAARNAVHLRFHNEEMKRLEDERRETEEIVNETRLAGLTGIAHIQTEGQIRIAKVNLDPNLDAAERDKRVAALQEQTAAEVAAAQLDWTKKVDQVVEQSQEHQVTGFARIRAEADRTRADLQRQFDEAHAKMDLRAPGAQAAYDQDTAQLGRGLRAVDQSSDAQQAELARRNAQDTAQIEEEAQRKSLSAMRQQSAAINAEYRARVQKYQEQLRQEEISQDDFNRRVAAAAEERDAEMVEASRAAREKMAGEFDSFFKSLDHPMKALEGLGDKVAGEAAATLMQALQQRAGRSTADSPAKGGGANVLLSMIEGFGFGEKQAPSTGHVAGASTPTPAMPSLWPWSRAHAAPSGTTTPVMPALPPNGPIAASAPAAHPEAIATGRIFEVGSATIRISSASISLVGSLPGSPGGGASGTNVGGSPAGGGTSLLGTPISSAQPQARPAYIGSQSGAAPTSGQGFRVFPSSALSAPQGDGWEDERSTAAPSSRSSITTQQSLSPSTLTFSSGGTAIAPAGSFTGSTLSGSVPSPSLPGGTVSLGGAGSSSVGSSGPFASAAGDYPQKTSILGSVVSNVQKGMQLTKQAKNIFSAGGTGGSAPASPGSSISAAASSGAETADIDSQTIPEQPLQSFPDSSLPTSSPGANPGMLGGGGVAANAAGAVGGALGMYSAVEGNGGVGGSLQGAMSGMQLGMALGGPIGAAIGAVGGAIVGAIGFGGREKARVYDLKTVRPKLTGDTDSFQQGSMDYTSAFSDMQATDWQARLATGQMGPAAHSYYDDTIAKEIKTAEARLTQEQKAGRSMYTASAAQYHTGDLVDNFGDFATSPTEGMAHVQLGEFMVKPNVAARNLGTLRSLNAGMSMDQIHASYQSTMQSRDARTGSQGGDRTMNMNVHAIDSKGVAQFLDKYKHHIRAAVNNASAENSGGGLA